jgi:hypothetical protein
MSAPILRQAQDDRAVEQEDLRPARWLRELLIVVYALAMGVVFALNFPEPVDCQRDGETARFAEGCQP